VAEEEQISEEQLLEALKRLRVSDVLVQSLSTISSLAFHRLAPETRDLEQARLAIETLRAVVPLLAGSVPEEIQRDFDAVRTNLQLAYARAAAEAGGDAASGDGGGTDG